MSWFDNYSYQFVSPFERTLFTSVSLLETDFLIDPIDTSNPPCHSIYYSMNGSSKLLYFYFGYKIVQFIHDKNRS